MSDLSTKLVASRKNVAASRAVNRSSLAMGDLYKNSNNGRTLMHTGKRTCPPSEVKRTQKTYGTTAAGRKIIGFQSIVVDGKIKSGEDGACVTFDGAKTVTLVGKASISLDLFK